MQQTLHCRFQRILNPLCLIQYKRIKINTVCRIVIAAQIPRCCTIQNSKPLSEKFIILECFKYSSSINQMPVNVVMALSLVFCAVNIIWK